MTVIASFLRYPVVHPELLKSRVVAYCTVLWMGVLEWSLYAQQAVRTAGNDVMSHHLVRSGD